MELQNTSQVMIYTAGECCGHSGPGGFGATLSQQGNCQKLSGGFRFTCLYRTKLWAINKALESLKQGSVVTLVSDSWYVVEAYNSGKIENWRRNGWRKARTGETIQNTDLWYDFYKLTLKHSVILKWGRPTDVANHDLCSKMAVLESKNRPSHMDIFYEKIGKFDHQVAIKNKVKQTQNHWLKYK